MGDYSYNRLFCVHEKIFIQLMSDGAYFGMPMPGMWINQSSILSVSFRFFECIFYTSFYISDCDLSGDIWVEPLPVGTQDGERIVVGNDWNYGCDDVVLYIADVCLFSW